MIANGEHDSPSDLIAFAVAFVGSLGLTIPVRHLALRYGMVDRPGPRKVHVKPIPLLGGIAIYLGFVLAILLYAPRRAPRSKWLGILAGATLLAAVGFLDDGGLLHHQVKLFIGMPVAALFLLASGIHAQFFSEFVPGMRGHDSRWLSHGVLGRGHHRSFQHSRPHGRPLRGNRRRGGGVLHAFGQSERADDRPHAGRRHSGCGARLFAMEFQSGKNFYGRWRGDVPRISDGRSRTENPARGSQLSPSHGLFPC